MEHTMPNMRRLSSDELKSRLRLDYQVCQYMFGHIVTGEAYQTTDDMEMRRNPILVSTNSHLAKKYRIDFKVKTLIGPGTFADMTTIGFDLDVRNYPYEEPATWLISNHVPYSPHFKLRSPICIGEIWQRAKGHILLGHLLIHIAKLLNWDEVERDSGYVGWNADAIRYHDRVYHGRPITPELQYPLLPPQLHGLSENQQHGNTQGDVWFRPLQPSPLLTPTDPSGTLFRGKGIV